MKVSTLIGLDCRPFQFCFLDLSYIAPNKICLKVSCLWNLNVNCYNVPVTELQHVDDI